MCYFPVIAGVEGFQQELCTDLSTDSVEKILQGSSGNFSRNHRNLAVYPDLFISIVC